MIKRLQRNFILISMLSLIIVTSGIFGMITFENFREINRQIDELINLIIENDGLIPDYKNRKENSSEFITKETKFSTRYFTIKLDSSGEIIETNMQYIAAVEQDDINYILEDVLSTNATTGFYGNYKYKIVQNNNYQFLIFLDCSMQINNFKFTLEKSVIIIGISYIIVFIAVWFFSKKALKPFITNIQKQKQFITNASHELKTPLAVITADLDVLELTYRRG